MEEGNSTHHAKADNQGNWRTPMEELFRNHLLNNKLRQGRN
jgi:hypothetical protein